MEPLISSLFIVVGLINVYPVIGVLGSTSLTNLYGVPLDETNLLILMRHRAVLLGLIGIFLFVAAGQRDWQLPALVAGLVSMLSFVVIAYFEGTFTAKITMVVIADVIGAVLLGIAGLVRLLIR